MEKTKAVEMDGEGGYCLKMKEKGGMGGPGGVHINHCAKPPHSG